MESSHKKAKHNNLKQSEHLEQLNQSDAYILDKIADVWINSRDHKNRLVLQIKQIKDYKNYKNKIVKDTWEFIFNQSQDEFKFNLKLINEEWNLLRINHHKEADAIREFMHKQATNTLDFKIKDLQATQDFLVNQFDIEQEFHIKQLNATGQEFHLKQLNETEYLHEHFIPNFHCEQAKALRIFYRQQADAFRLFNHKQAEITLDFQRKQADTIREYSCTASNTDSRFAIGDCTASNTDSRILLDYTFTQPDIILFFKQEQQKTINFQRQQSETRQFFHNKQANVTYDLEIQHAIAIQNFNNDIKAKFKVHLQCMLKYVKNKILESQLYDIQIPKSTKQKSFDLIIEQNTNFKTDNDEYNCIDNLTQQFVILLYLTKELDFVLDLDCIKYVLDNSCIKYLKIVSPMLNKITILTLEDYEHNLSFSLEFVELLLSFPNLQTLNINFMPSDIEFELPQQKLKIKDLSISLGYNENIEYNIININTLLKICPELVKLNLSCFHINTDNENLAKLGEILNKCYYLTDLTLSEFNESIENKDENEEELNFINVISQCTVSEGGSRVSERNSTNLTNLTKLDLSSNNIRFEQLINIAEILSKSSTLTYLDLSKNDNIEDDKKKIREILSQCKTLKEISL